MLRRAVLLTLAAALLACPSRVPKGLDPGAFVRIDSLGHPVVQVTRVEHGVLVCRMIPSMIPRHIPLDQIHKVEPVSAALVARMRSLAHAQGADAAMQRRLNALGDGMAASVQEFMRQNRQTELNPTMPVAPQRLGNPDLAPSGLDNLPSAGSDDTSGAGGGSGGSGGP